MSVYIDATGTLQHDQEKSLTVTCPHCQVLSHITPLAVPRFGELIEHRPKHVGVVYRCDACNAPVFLRFAAKMYGASRVELAPQFVEVERAREKFSFTYLPEEVELLFREALICFSHGAVNAFASMCRSTAQATFTDLGDAGRLRLFDQLNDVRDMAEIDAETFAALRRVIFGGEGDPRPNPPLLDGYQAGVLLEVMKDLLHQAYVRKGRLQQAMTVRRFFAEESENRIRPLPARA